MNKQTLAALKASIAKWEANVSAATPQDVTLGYLNCPLCHLFLDNDCTNCPANVTGEGGCHGTPYDDVTEAQLLWRHAINHPGQSNLTFREQDYRKATKRELDFLRSLLPEDHSQ